MSPRPHLAPGTYGDISTWAEQPYTDGKPRVRASALFRDSDGVTRQVTAIAQTKTRATAALRSKLAERRERTESGIVTPDTLVGVLARLWLDAPHPSWSVNTRETYEGTVKRQVTPTLGNLRVREVRPSTIVRAFETVRDTAGAGSAKMLRSVLAGMFDYALLHDAVQANPAKGLRIDSGKPSKGVRALTAVEVEQLADALRSDERATEMDLPDLVDWMLGTGCRIGEACAVRAAVLDEGTVEINATAVRVKGRGMVIQERPKSQAGWRVLALPSYLTPMLQRRASTDRLQPRRVTFLDERGEYRGEPRPGIVFTSPLGHVRDGSNTARTLRDALDRLDGFEWVTSHTFRKTVATRMLEGGIPLNIVSVQLGHARMSMTADKYLGRSVVSAEAVRLLDR